MTDAFAIEALSTTVTLDVGATGEVEVDVSNMLDRHVRAGVEVRAQPPLQAVWVRPQPATFDLAVNESRRVALAVTPPGDLEPQELRFTLRAYDVDRPAEVFTESPSITLALRRPREPRPRRASQGLLATVVGWLAGGAAGMLLGGVLAFGVFAPGPRREFDSFGEALGAAIGDTIAAAILAVLLAMLLGWVLSAAGVWLALRLRKHARAALTAALSFGIGIPWIVLVFLAGRAGDAVALLGWLLLLLLLAANPALAARLLVTRVLASRSTEPAEPAEPAASG